ncbi:hypothetical protein [Enterococcus pallens]|uniref:Uncharacterized protein n=1 Tax=Enterococcus pallens ATCC BAA-351 TaxID=1158607 RepID=R2QED5_9ENTE|nr:hypothetical protein [Enterococcus pallens]EOH94852.1 hypothetical protein UAU_01774 [Enterococcus pallens ATCC BAA-351]EOU14829.1 hypothetical protein I588_04479 [Enterococcus pallens ATCC BAA-351]OJG76206.1 hypothetical protein RV10_GL004113 [Enterococcus pallens]
MLKISKSITGESMIGEERVIYMNATVSEDHEGPASISQQINNRQLYNENKEECRRDIDDFPKLVRETEDSLIN